MTTIAFFGYTIEDYPVGNNGSVKVRGYFRQNDTFDPSLRVNRRDLRIFVMYSDDNDTIVYQQLVLNCTDGTDWLFRDVTINGLAPGRLVKIGFGRYDQWAADYELVAEWAGIDITSATWGSLSTGGGANTSIASLAIVSSLGLFAVSGFLAVAFRHRSGALSHRDEFEEELRQHVAQEETYAIPSHASDGCVSCGAIIRVPNSMYCRNCGARLEDDTKWDFTPVEEGQANNMIQKCMVCDLTINASEATMWCPHCGHPAHKEHMLEWLRQRDYCPLCLRQLNEREFKE